MVFGVNKSLIVLIMCISSFLILSDMVDAFEPIRPETNLVLPTSKEYNIKQIKQLSIEDSYNQIKDIILLYDEDYTHKAVYESFKNRKKQSINYALNKLKAPPYFYETETPIRNIDHEVSKRIFEIFPNESTTAILKAYESGDLTTKINIIKVIGNIEDNESRVIKRLLLATLEDKTEFDLEKAEITGEPMRICDYVYNQLVYRYRIKKVLRSIGNLHSIETREYHIERLKNHL